MKRKFVKMHGCGNDYIYFDCLENDLYDPETLSIILSDRHFGIGGDGIVLICPSAVADAKMRMFNADGSEGKMCGNAIRCVGKYLFDHKITEKTELDIETLSGVKHLTLHPENGKVKTVRVDMGKAALNPESLPVRLEGEKIADRETDVAGGRYRITCVSMGNPHCVLFTNDWENFDIDHFEMDTLGPKFEADPLFPERVNTEFVKLLPDGTLRMRVFERGSGETFACGTGACAAAVAAVETGLKKKGEPITVRLRGGELTIVYTDDGVQMTGPATEVFTGEIDC